MADNKTQDPKKTQDSASASKADEEKVTAAPDQNAEDQAPNLEEAYSSGDANAETDLQAEEEAVANVPEDYASPEADTEPPSEDKADASSTDESTPPESTIADEIPGAPTAASQDAMAQGEPENIRMLQVSVLRYNPADPESIPHMQTYQVAEAESMTLYILLNEIRDTQDPSLNFDFVCRAGICGSCAMLVNGKPALACRTLTRDLPNHFTLAPLPGFELISDLSVNTGKWMRGMSERIQTWCHLEGEKIDDCKIEKPMDPTLAEDIYLLDRCIECGICVAVCGNFRMRPDFVGAVAINKIARFRLDPRDKRNDADYYEVMGTESGVFGCLSLLACNDFCPKDLPLKTQIAFIRRKMAQQGITGKQHPTLQRVVPIRQLKLV